MPGRMQRMHDSHEWFGSVVELGIWRWRVADLNAHIVHCTLHNSSIMYDRTAEYSHSYCAKSIVITKDATNAHAARAHRCNAGQQRQGRVAYGIYL